MANHWVMEIHDQLNNNNETSSEMQRWSKQSIYMVPACIKDLNRKAYKPQVVSFGPFHHGDPDVRPMEEHKLRALVHFLKRAKKQLYEFVAAMKEVVPQLQDAYQGLDEQWKDKERFLQLMVLDGCFMLEIMRVATGGASSDYAFNDPIFSSHGMLYTVPYIKRDMMMIENQLPLLVFVEGDSKCVEHVNDLVLRFWSNLTLTLGEKRPHLLDMLRYSQLDKQSSTNPSGGTKNSSNYPIIRWASELDEAGIRFKERKSGSLLAIRFDNGVLSLPKLTVDDNTEYMFLNLMAYERLHVGTGNDVTSFVCFMDHIIDSAKDINLLHYKGIIRNAMGSDDAAAKLFNRLTKDVVLDPNSKIGEVHNKVAMYCQKKCTKYRATVVHTYFTIPGTFLSLVAGIVLLVLSVLQTIYTILQFHQSA